MKTKSEPKQKVLKIPEAMSKSVLGSGSGHQCVVSNTTEEEWASLGPAILTALEEDVQALVVAV